jgi:hypothetical protein
MGYRAETSSELLVRILVILRKLRGRPRTQFFSNGWMEQLQKCVHVNGEYVG